MNQPTDRVWPGPGFALTFTAIGVVTVFCAGWLWLNKPTLVVPAALVVLLVAGCCWWLSRRRLGSYIAYDEAQDHEVRDEWDGEHQPSSVD